MSLLRRIRWCRAIRGHPIHKPSNENSSPRLLQSPFCSSSTLHSHCTRLSSHISVPLARKHEGPAQNWSDRTASSWHLTHGQSKRHQWFHCNHTKTKWVWEVSDNYLFFFLHKEQEGTNKHKNIVWKQHFHHKTYKWLFVSLATLQKVCNMHMS